MPVVVVGASGFVGHHAVRAFARVSPEVRAYVRRREAAQALRELGAKVAVGWIHDIDNLAEVMRGAHTVCHLVGGVNLPTEDAYRESNLDSVRTCLRAAEQAGVRRFLFVSAAGAVTNSPNPYLRLKALAEEAIAHSEVPHAIFRATHVFGPRSTWLAFMREGASRFPARVPGTGRQLIAPVFVEDVVAVLTAADDRESVERRTWGIQGPDVLSADEIVDLLARRRRPKLHAGQGALGRVHRVGRGSVSPAALDLFSRDSLSDAPDGAREFAVARTSLREGLADRLPPAEPRLPPRFPPDR